MVLAKSLWSSVSASQPGLECRGSVRGTQLTVCEIMEARFHGLYPLLVVLLRELLELELLREAGLQIVTASDQIDRPIRWVHSGEIADIARFLSGGEVLLTAATGLGPPSVDRRRYVRELSQAGAAAMIMELGRTFAELPADMAEEAEAQGLLIATLDREVPFVAVTRLIHTAILNEQQQAQERATRIGDDFSRLVLEGAHVPEMLALLAERLDNPVVLEDGLRRVVAYGYGRRPVAPILREWQRHSRRGHQGNAVGVQAAESEPHCVWTSVALRGEIWGRLHVLEVDSPIDAVTRLALGRAASNVALYLMAERQTYLSETAERSLVSDAAHGTNFSGDEFLARATGLGIDFDEDLVTIIVSRPGGRRSSRRQLGRQQSSGCVIGFGKRNGQACWECCQVKSSWWPRRTLAVASGRVWPSWPRTWATRAPRIAWGSAGLPARRFCNVLIPRPRRRMTWARQCLPRWCITTTISCYIAC